MNSASTPTSTAHASRVPMITPGVGDPATSRRTGAWLAVTARACATASLAVTPASAISARARAGLLGMDRRAAAAFAATRAMRSPTADCSAWSACSRSPATASSAARLRTRIDDPAVARLPAGWLTAVTARYLPRPVIFSSRVMQGGGPASSMRLLGRYGALRRWTASTTAAR